MSVRSPFWTAVILAALASVSAQAADWPFPLAGGGGSIEVAVPSESISIRRYRVQTSASPYEHLKRSSEHPRSTTSLMRWAVAWSPAPSGITLTSMQFAAGSWVTLPASKCIIGQICRANMRR